MAETTVTPPEGQQAPGATPSEGAQNPQAGVNPKVGQEPPKDEKPPVRMSREDFILKRLEKKEAKLKTQKIAEIKQRITDEDEQKSAIQKAEQEARSQAREETEREIRKEKEFNEGVDSFIKDNPDFKTHEDTIRRWGTFPEYSRIPVKQLAYAVAGEDLLRIGAERGLASNQKAKTSQIPGNTPRNVQGVEKDYLNMPQEEFAKELSMRAQNR